MVTIGSVILAGLLFHGMISKKEYLMFLWKLLIVFAVYINIGYFFKADSFELTYAEFLTVMVSTIGIISLTKVRLTMETAIRWWAFLLTILLGYALLLFDPSPPMVIPVGVGWDDYVNGFAQMTEASLNGSHMRRFIRIILFFVAYYVFDAYILKNDERTETIKRFVVKIAVLSAWFGIIEQFTKLFGSDIITRISGQVFGIGISQLHHVIDRAGLPALQGLMMEPGHYAQSFLPAILILFRDSIFTETQRLRRFLLFAYVLFFSGSFAGFAILSFMLLLFLWSNKRTMTKKAMVFAAISTLSIGIIKFYKSALFDYYLQRVSALLFSENMGTSEGVRMISIQNALELLKESPIFGMGLGTMDAHGFIPSMLSNIGLLGSLLWFVIMVNGFTKTRVVNIQWLFALLPILFFIGDTGMIYSVSMILIFSFVFRHSVETEPVLSLSKLRTRHTQVLARNIRIPS